MKLSLAVVLAFAGAIMAAATPNALVSAHTPHRIINPTTLSLSYHQLTNLDSAQIARRLHGKRWLLHFQRCLLLRCLHWKYRTRRWILRVGKFYQSWVDSKRREYGGAKSTNKPTRLPRCLGSLIIITLVYTPCYPNAGPPRFDVA